MKLVERLKDKFKPAERPEELEYASEPDCADCGCTNPWIATVEGC